MHNGKRAEFMLCVLIVIAHKMESIVVIGFRLAIET